MANAIKWESSPSSSTVLSTELNALANNARSAVGTEYDNATNLNQFGFAELDLTFAVAPSDAAPYVILSMVPAADGTNYADGSATVDPGETRKVAVIPVRAVDTAQKIVTERFELPPFKCKFLLENQSGQALGASGHTVKLYPTNLEVQ